MKQTFFSFATLCLTILFASCGSGNGGDRTYSGSASYGDLVTFSTDGTTVTVVNETTGVTETHTFSTTDVADLDGIYKVTANGSSFYGVELDSKIIAANFPTGRAANLISFGVNSALDNTGKEASFAGDYVWIIIDDDTNKSWGQMTVNADGTWHKKDYASATTAPTDSGLESYPITASNSTEDGTYAVSGTNKERIVVTVAGSSLTGYGYIQDSNSSVFLIDLGTGNGFLLGIKIPTTALTDSFLTDSYKAITASQDGSSGAINFTFVGSGNGTFKHINNSSTVESGILNGFSRVTGFGNMFHGEVTVDSTTIDSYLVFTGDIFMFFNFEGGNFVMYGAGAKK